LVSLALFNLSRLDLILFSLCSVPLITLLHYITQIKWAFGDEDV
jgi:hypothetical protein